MPLLVEGERDENDPHEIEMRNRENVSLYAMRKGVSQGVLDVALMSANASELRSALSFPNRGHMFLLTVSAIGLSIVLQVTIGLLILIRGHQNLHNRTEAKKAERYNDIIMVLVFGTIVINVLITTFGNLNTADLSTEDLFRTNFTNT